MEKKTDCHFYLKHLYAFISNLYAQGWEEIDVNPGFGVSFHYTSSGTETWKKKLCKTGEKLLIFKL